MFSLLLLLQPPPSCRHQIMPDTIVAAAAGPPARDFDKSCPPAARRVVQARIWASRDPSRCFVRGIQQQCALSTLLFQQKNWRCSWDSNLDRSILYFLPACSKTFCSASGESSEVCPLSSNLSLAWFLSTKSRSSAWCLICLDRVISSCS
jgi:hypothetical protein